MRKLNSKHTILVSISFILSISVIFLSSCSLPIERKIKQKDVEEIYQRTAAAEKKYGEEPVSGELRPFPASFVLTGKLLWIEVPPFEDDLPSVPYEIYDEYNLDEYSWYTDEVGEIRYVVLLDIYYSPSDEHGLGNTLIFTIVDLSYGEMVYKSFLVGKDSLPYRELADLLEDITL
ncbi:MAG: hypothetical protein R3232_07730 [Clostridia bacterium]|nr:hypothetical protein [Clostridia bacterium]